MTHDRLRTKRPRTATLIIVVVLVVGSLSTPSLLPPPLYSPGVAEAATNNITVSVDANAAVHPISPWIYGVNDSGGGQAYYGTMGASLVRWGGNARTRYNWELSASNAGVDYGPYCNQSKNTAQSFVTANRTIGADSLLTIPTIGWVANNTSNCSTGVPGSGGWPANPAGSDAITGYDPTGNRGRTSVASSARKGAAFSGCTPNTGDSTVYQDEWVNCLVSTLGTAASGGVRLYAMDNEPDLWADNTHTDVHPLRVSYDEELQRFEAYAEAVKAVDPTAQVGGPIGWGWPSLWHSAVDQYGTCCGDQLAHGNLPFYVWLLQQLRQHDTAVGHRTLDVLDTHYYPQGGVALNQTVDATTSALRLRSVRSLWDPTYTDETWQASYVSAYDANCGGAQLRLLRCLQAWIASYYPGTQLGISEWNWGGDQSMNGALAIADVLGVFGREQVYYANVWSPPTDQSPGYWAWRMYRNYDGSNGRFGDTSVSAAVPTAAVNQLAAYASKDSGSGQLKLMLVNKDAANADAVTVSIANFAPTSAQVYRYSSAALTQIQRLPDLTGLTSTINLTLPAYSITLLVLPAGTGGLTSTSTPTPTSVPAATATRTPTRSATATSTPTMVPTAAPTATATPSITATSTAVLTPTNTPTRLPSPSPTTAALSTVACSPRPPVGISTSGGSSRLNVTVTDTTNASTPTNQLQSIAFGSATNALIDVPGGPTGSTGNFTVTLPAGTKQYNFTVRRAQPGATSTVPFTVVDACGSWPTFVGGGSNGF